MKNIKNWNEFLNEGLNPKDIVGKASNIAGHKSEEFKENMLVAPNRFYKDQNELKTNSGRVTKIEPEKITYQKNDGNLYANKPEELIIITGNFTA